MQTFFMSLFSKYYLNNVAANTTKKRQIQLQWQTYTYKVYIYININTGL